MRKLWLLPAFLFAFLACGALLALFQGGGLVDVLFNLAALCGLSWVARSFWRQATKPAAE